MLDGGVMRVPKRDGDICTGSIACSARKGVTGHDAWITLGDLGDTTLVRGRNPLRTIAQRQQHRRARMKF